MDNDQPTTIGEILLLPPSQGRDNKTWVGGPFEGIVRNPAERKGQGYVFYTCVLHDPHQSHLKIEATSDIDFRGMDGQLIEVSGKGISREEYKGIAKVKLGKNASVRVVGRPSGAAPDSSDTASAPATGKAERHPYGPAVGGSIEIAANAILQAGLAVPGSPEFSTLLFQIGSDVLRVNEHMEAGNLAPGPKKRAGAGDEDAEAQAKAEAMAKAKAEAEAKARMKAELEREAAEANMAPDDEEDDDVPF